MGRWPILKIRPGCFERPFPRRRSRFLGWRSGRLSARRRCAWDGLFETTMRDTCCALTLSPVRERCGFSSVSSATCSSRTAGRESTSCGCRTSSGKSSPELCCLGVSPHWRRRNASAFCRGWWISYSWTRPISRMRLIWRSARIGKPSNPEDCSRGTITIHSPPSNTMLTASLRPRERN